MSETGAGPPGRDTHRRRVDGGPLAFFGLVFAISVPFWVLGPLVDELPGWFPENLPTSALMTFCPAIAAGVLVYNRDGWDGLRRSLKRIVHFDRTTNLRWFMLAVLVFPVITLLSYAVLSLLDRPLPDPRFALATVPALAVVYFVTAIGEELGWTGYALDPIQDRRGALNAAILLGGVTAIWHLVPYVQGGNSARWIAGQVVFTVAGRVVLVWIYNNTARSVLAAVVVHQMSNMSWNLFPNNGSHYDPVVTGIITAIVAVVAVIGWGPRTLTRDAAPAGVRPAPRPSGCDMA